MGSNLLTCAWNRCAPNQAKVAHRPSPINNIRPKYILSLIGVTRRVICKSAWRPPTPRSPHRKHREKWRPDLFHTPALHSGGNRVAKRIWPGRAIQCGLIELAHSLRIVVRDGDEPRCPTRRRRPRRCPPHCRCFIGIVEPLAAHRDACRGVACEAECILLKYFCTPANQAKFANCNGPRCAGGGGAPAALISIRPRKRYPRARLATYFIYTRSRLRFKTRQKNGRTRHI